MEQKGEKLCKWIATGRRDLLWRSAEHLVILSLTERSLLAHSNTVLELGDVHDGEEF